METVVRQINENGNKISRISWAAVFAGTLTAIAISFLLNILGLGIGFATINPLTEANPLDGLGTGTIIWWIVTNLAALFMGGMIAARMSGYASNIDGALHGFLSWALYALLSFFLLTTTIGSIFNGMANAASSLFGGDGSKNVQIQLDDSSKSAKEQTGLSSDKIKREIFKVINMGEKYNVLPDDAAEETQDFLKDSKQDFKNLNLEDDIENFFNDISFDLDNNGNLDIKVEGGKDYFDKAALKDYISDNTELTDAQINGLINKWERNIEKAVDKAERLYASAKRKATVYADKAADAIAKYSIIAFFVMLLGAAAAMFGGATGSPEYILSRRGHVKKS